MKKQVLSTIIMCLLTFAFHAQGPEWLWGNGGGGTGTDAGLDICTDGTGNVYVTGYFLSNTIDFGDITLSKTDNGIYEDMFIVKYDPAGNVLWAKSTGGNLSDIGTGIACDASGNVIVNGYFESAVIVFDNTTLTTTAGRNFFLVKYDPSGALLWAKSADASAIVNGVDVCTDANENIFLTGFFRSASMTIGNTVLTNSSTVFYADDIFIAKYDSNGNVLWAKGAGGSDTERSSSICTDASGNALITGFFLSSSVEFDNSSVVNPNAANGTIEIFIAKYDPTGAVIWANSAGGTKSEIANDICADAIGNIFITGNFNSPSITFDNLTLTKPSSGNYEDLFIAKYSSAGGILWAKCNGNPLVDSGSGIYCDALGNTTIVGNFSSTGLLFGTTTLINEASYAGGTDIFIVRYNAAGNVVWAKKPRGSAAKYASRVCGDAAGNTIITGSFASPLIAFGNDTLNNAGNPLNNLDMFVAKLEKLNDTGLPAPGNSGTVRIFPNPITQMATIHSRKTFANASLIIYNCLGKIVKQNNHLSGEEIVFSREGLGSGLYFVRLLQDDHEVLAEKILVAD